MALSRRGTIRRKTRAPRARLEQGISSSDIQDILWFNRLYPAYFPTYKFSADLMKIYKLLVNDPELWQEGLTYKINPADKVHLIFGTSFRHIYTYKATESFSLAVGTLVGELPPNYTVSKARAIVEGDTILIRRDTRDQELKIEMQILSSGIFQDSSEDFRQFILNTSDLAAVRKHLKLIDNDGLKEQFV